MSDKQLQSMTEQEIRARFHCAPAYYLQAKLERKRALERRKHRSLKAAKPARQALSTREEPARTPPEIVDAMPAVQSAPEFGPELADALPNDLLSDSDIDPLMEPMADAMPDFMTESTDTFMVAPVGEPESLDLALPGFEILEAALAEFDDRNTTPEASVDVDLGLTQQAILEAALEDYGNWPFLSDPKTGGAPGVDPEVEAWFDLDEVAETTMVAEPAIAPEPQPEPEHDSEPKLTLVRERPAEPSEDSDLEDLLQQLLDSEPDLDLVLDKDPELEEALAAEVESAARADNVMHGDFGNHSSPTVRVVSVAMDRKRPNMVRIVRESSRLAS
jgi:hypothetical protein